MEIKFAIKCQECLCPSVGSVSQQCDRNNGRCQCLKGLTGYYCDRCDRGTTDEAPFCRKCGDCFDDWDQIILGLSGIFKF